MEIPFLSGVGVRPRSSQWEEPNWAWPLGASLQPHTVCCPDFTSRLKYNLGERGVAFFCLKCLSPISFEVNSGLPGVCQLWLPFITTECHVLVWAFFSVCLKVLFWFSFFFKGTQIFKSEVKVPLGTCVKTNVKFCNECGWTTNKKLFNLDWIETPETCFQVTVKKHF